MLYLHLKKKSFTNLFHCAFEKNTPSIQFFLWISTYVGMRSSRIFKHTNRLREIDLPCCANLTCDAIFARTCFILAPGVCWDIYKGYVRVQRFLLQSVRAHNNCVYLVCIHLKIYNNMQMYESVSTLLAPYIYFIF